MINDAKGKGTIAITIKQKIDWDDESTVAGTVAGGVEEEKKGEEGGFSDFENNLSGEEETLTKKERA